MGSARADYKYKYVHNVSGFQYEMGKLSLI